MEYPDRPHLTHSRPLRFTRRALTDAERSAIDHLLALLESSETRKRQRRADDRERLRATLEAVTLDLYRAAKADPELFLSYSRRKEDYIGSEAPALVTLTTVTVVVDFLERANFATTRLGSYSRRANPFAAGEVGSGYLSRIRAEPLLIDMLEGVFAVTVAGIGIAKEAHGRLIILKAAPAARGGTKRSLRFNETEQTRAMRGRIAAGNSLRAECSFAFDGEEPEGIELDDTELHRTFNNGRWDHGGRFYGGWWQSLGKIDRSRILIDGEETVELDFRAHHPRLCYHLAGQPLAQDHDPYLIPGFDAATYRDAAKSAFAQLLNSAPNQSPKRTAAAKGLFRSPKDYSVFVSSVEEAFQPVQSWLRAGRGMEMQFIDSQIADAVLEMLTAQGIPCLPVHDSFIVPRSSELTLGRAMIDGYARVAAELTEVHALPAIAGWSSPGVERAAYAYLASSPT